MFQVQVLPARVTGGEGCYALDGIDITGFEVAGARIAVGAANGSFHFESFAETRTTGKGRILRTNLIRQRTGWTWLRDETAFQNFTGIPRPSILVSVEWGGKHHYAQTVDFERLRLAHYPEAPSEPRLRPTCRARDILLSEQIGAIRMRGRERPVYDAIRVLAA